VEKITLKFTLSNTEQRHIFWGQKHCLEKETFNFCFRHVNTENNHVGFHANLRKQRLDISVYYKPKALPGNAVVLFSFLVHLNTLHNFHVTCWSTLKNNFHVTCGSTLNSSTSPLNVASLDEYHMKTSTTFNSACKSPPRLLDPETSKNKASGSAEFTAFKLIILSSHLIFFCQEQSPGKQTREWHWTFGKCWHFFYSLGHG